MGVVLRSLVEVVRERSAKRGRRSVHAEWMCGVSGEVVPGARHDILYYVLRFTFGRMNIIH